MLCDHLEEQDKEGGRETQEGRDMGKLGQSEKVAWTYTLPNVKQIASGKQLHSKGRSVWCFVIT